MMNNGKAARSSALVPEMVDVAAEAGVGMMRDLVKQIVADNPLEEKLSTSGNCHKGKGDAVGKKNYMELKLTEQILSIVERITEKFIKNRFTLMICSFASCQYMKLLKQFVS